MRNTMMLSGKQTQDEMIKSVDKGIFAVSFGGGQVDITSGKFVFNCTEAYEINNGKIGSPIKGATLIGDGPSILKEVSMVGNDMMMDPGIGTCGKAGQGVPVGVAQPSILIDKMTVGGTKLQKMIKDQEYLEKKASYCLDLGKNLGATDISVKVVSSISETVNFRNKKR